MKEILNCDYQLATGQKAEARLKIAQSIYGEDSQHLLSKLISPGDTVIDMGCGPGEMTLWIANQVGPQGKVIAIDIHQQQLNVLKQRAEKANINHIDTIQSDVYQSDSIKVKAQVVYSRLFLSHLKEPVEALIKMRNLAAPDGKIVCEEPITSTITCYPDHKAFNEHIRLFVELGKKTNANYDIGKQLPTLFSHADINCVEIHRHQHSSKSIEEKQIKVLTIKELYDKFVEKQLATPEQLNKLIKDFQSLAEDKTTIFSSACMVQAVGVNTHRA